MRRALSLTAIVVGVVAAVATSAGGTDGISGTAGPFTTQLDTATPSEENAVDALLEANIEIADDGTIDLTTTFDGVDVASVEITLTSLTSGETTSIIVDTDVQPQVAIGIDAFDGCDGLVPCNEELLVSFSLVQGDSITFDWELSGGVSVITDEEDPALGTLTFTLQ